MAKKSLFFLLLTLFPIAAFPQYRLNFGLTQPQDPSTLPVSASKPPMPVPKPKKDIPPSLQKISDHEFLLNSGWEMADADQVTASEKSIFSDSYNTSEWLNATVPGTVLTTLVNQGICPHPYYGLNNLNIPDSLCRKDWWYRLELPLPENSAGKTVWLLFNGINYKADVWLNGKLLGRTAGAFVRGNFEATKFIRKQGKNILAVHIYPPHNPGIPHEESSRTPAGPNGGQLCLDGPTFISSEGWDWIPGIRDRNIGIWQDVRLRLTDAVTLSDPQVITDLPLPDTTEAAIIVRAMVKNNSGERKEISLEGTIGDVKFSKNIVLNPGQSEVVEFAPATFTQLNFKNPRLWWPNGYGRQELYTLNLRAITGQEVSDQISTRFGIREFSYELALAQPDKKMWRVEFNPVKASGKVLFNNIDRTDVGKGTFLPKIAEGADASVLTSLDQDSKNPFLTIRVNGVPVFCKGGNWGMDDGMKRVSREKLEPYFRLHKDANFNMVRNWTGESTEEVFYDLCDEYGMLVWNDFWLSTEGYNLDVNDNDLFVANATDVVKRFRNHPSIAIWCPRNEGYAPALLEPRLAKLIAEEDGTRHYSPNSRNLNLRPSGPWHYMKDASEYYRNIAEGFNTELGTPSVPTAATIRSFMPVEDQWPISDTWYYHDLHNGQKEYIAAIEEYFGKAESLDDFCKKAQPVNYDSHRAMFESWNSKMWNNASGLLLWMSHPAWPSTVWQTYSWDYETFGSYYGAKKACEPVHIQMNPTDMKVEVINTTLKDYPATKASVEVFDISGKRLFQKEQAVNVHANNLTECFIPEFPQKLPGVYLIRLSLLNGKTVISRNEYRKSNDEKHFQSLNDLGNVQLKAKMIRSASGRMTFEVINPSKTAALDLKFNIRDTGTGKLVLPAYFSDGYFTLLPGEKKMIDAEWNADLKNTEVIVEGYNVRSQGIVRF